MTEFSDKFVADLLQFVKIGLQFLLLLDTLVMSPSGDIYGWYLYYSKVSIIFTFTNSILIPK